MTIAWSPDERASALVPRRDELVSALPRVLPAAQTLSEDEREFVVDDALMYTVVDHPDPIDSAEQAERIFWSICQSRIARTKDGRHHTVRAGYERAADAALVDVADGADDPARIVEQTAELHHAAEFAATLDEVEGQVMRLKWLSGSSRPVGYRRIAGQLGLSLLEVRSAERAIAHKLEAFATLCAAGRLCDERAADIAKLATAAAGGAVAAAEAHLRHCATCKADHVAQLRAVRAAAFQRQVASLIPAAPLAETARRHGGQLRDLATDWAGRGHDAAVASSQAAATGIGRGTGGMLVLKLAAVLAGAAATVGVGTGIFDAPSPPTRPERVERTPTPTLAPTRSPEPIATPDPREAAAVARRAARRQAQRRQRQEKTGASAQENPAPASPAPAGSQPSGGSEFSPDSASLPSAAPAPAPAAPGASEFP